MIDKSLAILFSLLILGQAYGVRRYAGTWVVPGALFGLFWFAMTIVPLVVLASIPIDPYGTGFIFLCLFLFSAGALFFPWRRAILKNRSAAKTVTSVYSTFFLQRSFYLLSAAAIVSICLNSLAQGITVHDLMFHLIAIAASYRERVSFGQLEVNIWARIGEILVYDVAILGGLIISTMPTKWGRIRVITLSFMPSVFMAVAQSTKWTMFSCVAFFYAGILTERVAQGNFGLLKKGSLKKAVLYGAILLIVTLASFMSRGLQDSDDTKLIKDHLLYLLASYSSGHLYAFSDWCAYKLGRHSQIHYDQEGTSYGFYTFSPIFRTLGSTKVVPDGVYDDYYSYENVLATNIYTVYRGLIQDFGVVGSLIFMFLLGLVFHGAFYALVIGRCPSISATIFIFSLGFIYASYGRSLFTWSSLYFTFVLMWLLLYWNRNSVTFHRILRFGVQNLHHAGGPESGVAI